MCRCLYCYKPLAAGETHFHAVCAKRFFGTREVPVLPYARDQLDQLALQVIRASTTLTGVQPKLSLNLQRHEGSQRLTIVGLWGDYIMKPQTEQYAELPEIEDLTMHLAEIARISVVPHTLMRMADGSLCYLTRRIDRTPQGGKIAMEDMCQLTNRLTEYKYHGSYELVAETIARYSTVPKMDVANLFEVVLFSWLTGNNDMHLKNFSLYSPDDIQIRLTPAYDLVNAAIINPRDDDEQALTLNNRRKQLTINDFSQALSSMGLPAVILNRLVAKYRRLIPQFEQAIKISFLSADMKQRYISLLHDRMNRFYH